MLDTLENWWRSLPRFFRYGVYLILALGALTTAYNLLTGQSLIG